MKFTTAVFAAGALFVSVSSVPVRRDVDSSLIPDFGHQAGLNPDGTGNCDGVPGPDGKPILVPCACPPDRALFIADLNANVAAGHVVNNTGIAVSFPSDNSQASQLARINAALVTLQNLRGPGVGCPASSTTFVAQQKAIQDGTAAPAPAAPAQAAAPASSSAASAPTTGGVDPALVPEFGVTAGQSPDGTGNCIGINNIKIPCSCPPDRQTFINDLNANVAAGHAVNNPSVSLSFPTGNSNADQAARIQASIITLQNLNGPGVGCPAASTTFSAQLAAVL